MNYQDRLDELNKNINEREVLESIDRPIRELVKQLNRIGLKTMWSCCGFNYDGEEEPKSHASQTFVVILDPETKEEKEVFFILAQIIAVSRWEIHKYSYWQWRIFLPRKKDQETGWTKDNTGTAIHDYELQVMEIANLAQRLSRMDGKDEYFIEDGNKMQVTMWPHFKDEWQVKPKRTSRVRVSPYE